MKNSSKLRLPFFLALLCVLSLSLVLPSQAGFRYSLKHAGNRCRAFSFPYWSLMDGEAPAGRSVYLEFRRQPQLKDQILVRGRLHLGLLGLDVEYTRQIYRISLTSNRELIPASEEEWDGAEILNPNPTYEEGTEAYRLGRSVPNASFVELNGHKLSIRGQYWPFLDVRVMLSPSGRYAVLQSMDGRLNERRGDFYSGHFYYQIYDLQTGAELFWVDGSWRWQDSTKFFKLTDWVTDNIVVLVPDEETQKGIVICHVPE